MGIIKCKTGKTQKFAHRDYRWQKETQMNTVYLNYHHQQRELKRKCLPYNRQQRLKRECLPSKQRLKMPSKQRLKMPSKQRLMSWCDHHQGSQRRSQRKVTKAAQTNSLSDVRQLTCSEVRKCQRNLDSR